MLSKPCRPEDRECSRQKSTEHRSTKERLQGGKAGQARKQQIEEVSSTDPSSEDEHTLTLQRTRRDLVCGEPDAELVRLRLDGRPRAPSVSNIESRMTLKENLTIRDCLLHADLRCNVRQAVCFVADQERRMTLVGAAAPLEIAIVEVFRGEPTFRAWQISGSRSAVEWYLQPRGWILLTCRKRERKRRLKWLRKRIGQEERTGTHLTWSAVELEYPTEKSAFSSIEQLFTVRGSSTEARSRRDEATALRPRQPVKVHGEAWWQHKWRFVGNLINGDEHTFTVPGLSSQKQAEMAVHFALAKRLNVPVRCVSLIWYPLDVQSAPSDHRAQILFTTERIPFGSLGRIDFTCLSCGDPCDHAGQGVQEYGTRVHARSPVRCGRCHPCEICENCSVQIRICTKSFMLVLRRVRATETEFCRSYPAAREIIRLSASHLDFPMCFLCLQEYEDVEELQTEHDWDTIPVELQMERVLHSIVQSSKYWKSLAPALERRYLLTREMHEGEPRTIEEARRREKGRVEEPDPTARLQLLLERYAIGTWTGR